MRPGLAFRAFASVMCALFVLSVAVQYNDPDPELWMPIYGLAAALAGLGAAGRLPLRANAAALVVYLALFALWAPTLVGARHQAFESWRMQAPEDEEPREAGGLALCALWSAVQTLTARRLRSARAAPAGW
jgi:branched-subunit amino acid transport protein